MTTFLLKRPWMVDSATTAVMTALAKAGGPDCARFVGGCVRDTLLGRDVQDLDVDIATFVTPDRVMVELTAQGLRVEPTGLAHGTVTAIALGRAFEITTLRRDVETDGRHAVVAFTRDWAQDAARRDFTLNALYADPDGRVHDPTGRGLDDALAGRVIFVGEPEARIREDYLRILRFFRFQAQYGASPPDADAVAACARHADRLSELSVERIAKEVLKLLAADDPRVAVHLMAKTGVLAKISCDLANVRRFDALVAIEADLGGLPDPVLRLAALGPSDREGVEHLSRRWKLSNAMRKRLLCACANDGERMAQMSPHAWRKAVWRLGGLACRDQLLLAWANDGSPTFAPLWRERLDLVETWQPPPFPVSGDEILQGGVEMGPRVGRVRKALEDWWLDCDFPQDKALVMEKLKALIKDLA